MKRFWILGFLVVTVGMPAMAEATDLSVAKGLVDHIRAAELPQVSSGTKESPVGQPISDYKPKGPSVSYGEPPSPIDRNNPQNDPDVQKGFDEHQDWYYGS